MLNTLIFLADSDIISKLVGNKIIFGFEVVAMVISILIIIVGIVQNKKSQTGLSALNGGNEELFSNSKERGLDKTLSIWMLSLGSLLFITTIVICILTTLTVK